MVYIVDTKELKKRMIDEGYDTIDALSTACGVNRNTVSDVINGRAFPSSLVMSKIGETLRMCGHDMGAIFFAQKLT